MSVTFCFGCMKTLEEEQEKCPYCGFERNDYVTLPHALPLGEILHGRYLMGRVLGQGGFGITYIGYDLMLEARVAIKEYYPSGQVIRAPGSAALTWTHAADAKTGCSRFLQEAQKMEKISDSQSVVRVRDIFLDNDTAYIVMDYAEGITLKERYQRIGTITPKECFNELAPILEGLAQFHEAGLIHRDISPDNIVIDSAGKAILLDLGAAKDLNTNGSGNTQLVGKHGFSPPEQYTENGKIGPWTDVYAMCATILYCLTGRIVPEAISRFSKDTLDVSGLNKPLAAVLSKGLSLNRQERYGSMLELKAAWEDALNQKPKKRMLFACAASVCCIAAAMLALNIPRAAPEKASLLETTEMSQPTEETSAPTNTPTEETVSETTLPIKRNELRRPETSDEILKIYGGAGPTNSGAPFWGQTKYKRKDVKTVTFHSTMDDVLENAWDVSANEDGSIMAWMDGSALHVAADGIIMCTSGENMFEGFANMTSIDWGDCFDTSLVRSMSNMFLNCRNLVSLDLSGFDTSNVRNMVGMFAGCPRLVSVDLSGFDTAHVTDMSYLFHYCGNLTDVDLSGFDVSKVPEEKMAQMFTGCYSLSDDTVPSWYKGQR